jgi:hypothetical protein
MKWFGIYKSWEYLGTSEYKRVLVTEQTQMPLSLCWPVQQIEIFDWATQIYLYKYREK